MFERAKSFGFDLRADSTLGQFSAHLWDQGGITCEAIDEPRKSSNATDERVIINFCNKNVVIARFCDNNEVFVLFSDIYIYIAD